MRTPLVWMHRVPLKTGTTVVLMTGPLLCEDNTGLDTEVSFEDGYYCSTEDKTPAM